VSRAILTHADVRPPVFEQFAADFSRLMTAVERLIADMSSVVGESGANGKTNGARKRGTKNASASISGRAQLFLEKLGSSTSFHERIPVACMELDANGNIVRANEECRSVLNAAQKQILGSSLFDFVPAAHAERLRQHFTTCRGTDKPGFIDTLIKGHGSPAELRIRRRSGGKLPSYLAVLLNHPIGIRNGSAECPSGERPMFCDLFSKLNRAYTLTSVVQLIADYFSTALASPEGMIFVDSGRHPRLAWQWSTREGSMRHLEESGLPRGLLAKTFHTGNAAFCAQGDTSHPAISLYLRRAFPDSKTAGVAFIPIGAGGASSLPVAVVVMVLLHERSLTPEFIQDIRFSGRLAAESIVRARTYDEALAASLEAQNANRRKEEFFSMMTHELKNPLAPILGWAISLSSGTLSADKQILAIEGIVRNARALNYLIEDLFDTARISSGKLQLEISEMRLQEVVRDALSIIQPAAENKKLRISTDISEAIPPFRADSRRVRQVLVNLLNNAVKFTPNGGTIALKVLRQGRMVQCIVSDSGRGIDPKFLPFVFDRFRQESRSEKPSGAGLGLGLAIVKEITELHGGSVKAHSLGTDKGATFTVELPLQLNRTARPSVRRRASARKFQQRRTR
jgi:signal transduction histidine kinase